MDTLALLLGFQVASIASVVLHELGHALAAHWVGFKLHAIRLGWGDPIRTWRFGDLAVHFCGYPASGWVEAFPLKPDGYRWKSFVMTAAGPVATVLLLAVSLSFALSYAGVLGAAAGLVAAANAWLALFTLLPYESRFRSNPMPNDALLMIRAPRLTDAEIYDYVTAGWFTRAEQLSQRGSNERAFRWIRRAVSRGRLMRRETYFYAACFMHERDAFTEAEALIREGFDLPEDSSLPLETRCQVADAIATIVICRPYTGLARQCLEIIDQILSQPPDRPTLHGTRGGLLFELGDYAAAEGELTMCLDQGRSALDRGISSAYLAVLSRSRGDEMSARNYEEIALNCGAKHEIIDRLLRKTPSKSEPLHDTPTPTHA